MEELKKNVREEEGKVKEDSRNDDGKEMLYIFTM